MLDAGIFFMWPDGMGQRFSNLIEPPPAPGSTEAAEAAAKPAAQRKEELRAMWLNTYAEPTSASGTAAHDAWLEN